MQYHMFPPRHEPLVDDLGGIVAASIDMYAFLDDRVRASPQSLTDLVATGLDLGLAGRGRTHVGQLGWDRTRAARSFSPGRSRDGNVRGVREELVGERG